MKRAFIIGGVLLSLVCGGAVLAADRDVCPTCTYTTIQSAINAASNGDRIRVTQGTYAENLNNNATSITISGGWSADFSTQTRDPSLTVVDGGGSGKVLNTANASADITVQNITLQNGTDDWGACFEATATTPVDITFEDVIFQDCECTQGHGGAICILSLGTQMRARFTNVIVRDSAVATVSGTGGGGAMYLATGDYDPGSGPIPGELEVFIVNSLIYDNEANREGGGLLVWAQDDSSTRCVILNSTITENTSTSVSVGGGGVVVADGSSASDTAILEMYNSIIYGNTASPGADLSIDLTGTASRADVYECDINVVNNISGTYNNGDNINDDPDFVDVTALDPYDWDLRLESTSPCIDEGENEPPSLLPYTDLDGNRRVVTAVMSILMSM